MAEGNLKISINWETYHKLADSIIRNFSQIDIQLQHNPNHKTPKAFLIKIDKLLITLKFTHQNKEPRITKTILKEKTKVLHVSQCLKSRLIRMAKIKKIRFNVAKDAGQQNSYCLKE